MFYVQRGKVKMAYPHFGTCQCETATTLIIACRVYGGAILPVELISTTHTCKDIEDLQTFVDGAQAISINDAYNKLSSRFQIKEWEF